MTVGYSLYYHEEVRQDIANAEAYYNQQQIQLGKRFRDDVRNAIYRLKNHPHVHAIRYQKIRLAHTDVFPFSIHYYIDEKNTSVIVLAVLHNRRNYKTVTQRHK